MERYMNPIITLGENNNHIITSGEILVTNAQLTEAHMTGGSSISTDKFHKCGRSKRKYLVVR